ncbi:MAG TPA: FG-GAP-like repeat-containing protein [Vicinamibacterales bacterium]|nr:FG-GAP-like repeat-containing protein [Vicinamibacterales bacterium]
MWKGAAAGANAGAYLDLGDMSGDGRRDLIVGAPGNGSTAGIVYIIFGGPDRSGLISLNTAEARITSSTPGNLFGAATANGNIITVESSNPKDLVVGAPGANGGKGAVYLYTGAFPLNARLTDADARLTIVGEAGDQLGAALATGDLDKDGHREIIIGAPGNNRVYIIKGSPSLSGTIDLGATPGAAAAIIGAPGIGRSLIAGDITGDGIYDVLIGAPSQNVVYGFTGSTGVIPTTAAISFSGVSAGDEAGTSIRLLDIDDDGKTDIVISAPGGNGPGNSRSHAGNVYLFLGPVSAGAHSLSEAQVVFYGSAPNARAGDKLATGDINRDTFNDLVILESGGTAGAGTLDIYYGRARTSIGTLDAGATERVVDMATAGQVNRHIFGDPGAGAIASVQTYEVTGEGARDIIVGVPSVDSSTGQLYFTISPRLIISSNTLSLTTNEGSSATSVTPINVTNPSIVITGWEATSTTGWLSASPAGGSIDSTHPGAFYVVASAASLSPGTYTGTLNVSATSPDLIMTLPITVTLTVTGTRLSIDTPADGATVSNGFTLQGWAIDAASTSGTGISAVDVYAFPPTPGSAAGMFLGVAAYGGSRPDVASAFGSQFANSGFALTVNSLTPGQSYRIIVFPKSSISGQFSASKTIKVTVSSSSPPASSPPTDPNSPPPSDPGAPLPGGGGPNANTRVSVNRTTLYFGGTNNGSLLSGAQTGVITFTQGSSTWNVTSDQTWLTVSPASGNGNGRFSVSVNAGTYPNGTTRSATLTITAPGVPNSPITLPVQLKVMAATTAPRGFFDTPVDGSTGVVGALPVTGWAVDDLGITTVAIWRDPIPGEPASSSNGKVFIGTATPVDGARSDIETANQTPFNYQAGWGYMMLTNFLPNQGNGTFRIYAIATDVEGNTTTIGSKTITCDNADATKPFGTIDTPDQGGTASGGGYVNFGWVLGAQNNAIPTDGSTLTVFIDGVPVGHPTYNNARSDIQTLFPGHVNTNGAVGFYVINTTTLSNGVHTIAWGATDAAGHTEGIGSRFFNVLNGASASVMTTPALMQGSSGLDATTREGAPAGSFIGQGTTAVAAAAAPTDTPAYVQQGFAMNAPLDLVQDGVVHSEELQTVRVLVGAPTTDAGSYEGYIAKGGKLDALPAGSFLDRHTGEFFWQPGVGFVGTYNFVFVRTEDGVLTRIPLTVEIAPRK